MRWVVLGLWAAVAGAGPAPILERPDADVQAGIEALRAGDAEAALSRFDRAAQARPDRGEIHWNRGLALRALGRLDETKEAFSRALAAGAAREALHGLGHLYAEEGDLERAIATFRAALERDPEDAVARRNLEALLRRRAQQNGQSQPEASASAEPQTSESAPQEREDGEEGDQGSQENSREESRSEAGEEGGGSSGEETEREQARAGEGGGEPEARRAQEQPGDAQAEGTAPGRDPGSEREGSEKGQGVVSGEEGRGEPEGEGAVMGPRDPDSLSRTERILDALRARERSLQLLRPQDRTRSRRDVDKDW